MLQDVLCKFCSRSTKSPEGDPVPTPGQEPSPGRLVQRQGLGQLVGPSHGSPDDPAGPGAAVDLGVFG